jgi:hypothetical protein
MYDRIYKSDVLWKRVRSGEGAEGVDQAKLRSIEEQALGTTFR